MNKEFQTTVIAPLSSESVLPDLVDSIYSVLSESWEIVLVIHPDIPTMRADLSFRLHKKGSTDVAYISKSAITGCYIITVFKGDEHFSIDTRVFHEGEWEEAIALIDPVFVPDETETVDLLGDLSDALS